MNKLFGAGTFILGLVLGAGLFKLTLDPTPHLQHIVRKHHRQVASVYPSPPLAAVSELDCLAIQRSTKFSRACGSTGTPTWPLLITGVGRSGTQYMTALLQGLGFDFNHDTKPPGKDGSVSWVLAFNSKRFPSPIFSSWDGNGTFEKVFHQVRHPLRSIASRVTGALGEVWIDVNSPVDRMHGGNSLRRALQHWVSWNMHIMRIADWTYRIEDVDVLQLCLRAGFSDRCPSPALVDHVTKRLSKSKHHRDHEAVTWEDLAAIDPVLTQVAMDLGALFGYDTGYLPLADLPASELLNDKVFMDRWNERARRMREKKHGGAGINGTV